MKPPKIILFLLCLSTQVLQLEAENIIVRVLNANGGQPIRRQSIWVYCGRPARSTPLKRNTNDEGVAVFVLPEQPIDELFIIDVNDVHACSRPSFSLAGVLSKGVVADNICDPKRKLIESTRAKPGEVIIFVKPVSRWEGQR
jgi:hypothetical protein